MTKRIPRVVVAVALASFLLCAATAAGQIQDKSYLADRALLEETQRAAFLYMWEGGCPDSGMAYESSRDWNFRPVAVGGTGFGVAAVVVAADRGWITRNQAVARLLKITDFLLHKTERTELHGALPHWLDGKTGQTFAFGELDDGADIVETSLLMQGLLIARAYFNGPGDEERLRRDVTELWEGVDWNWFTNGEENGLYWHWSRKYGFTGLKILGYNECLVTYLLAASSPTHPIGRAAYDYWTSGDSYRPKAVNGYELEATAGGGGPLFLAHYSFIGIDPRRVADGFVTRGYFVRNLIQTLANRGFCLQDAQRENRYAPDFWGLSAGQTKDGYAVGSAYSDSGMVAPTAALSSMPYTPYYSMQVLRNLADGLRETVWGRYGPYDGISLRDDWTSGDYLAIDQLPIVCMIENYRSGLLWGMFMSDPDVRRGLDVCGLVPPELLPGFPEAVVTLDRVNVEFVETAYDAIRHPDSGAYSIPYWSAEDGEATFVLRGQNGQALFEETRKAKKGRNFLVFTQAGPSDGKVLTLVMSQGGAEYMLPLRLN